MTSQPSRPWWQRPRTVVAGAAVIAIGVTLAVWLAARSGDRAVVPIAARLLACPPERIEVLSSATSDTSEIYRVRACGREAELVCQSPDFECFVSTP